MAETFAFCIFYVFYHLKKNPHQNWPHAKLTITKLLLWVNKTMNMYGNMSRYNICLLKGVLLKHSSLKKKPTIKWLFKVSVFLKPYNWNIIIFKLRTMYKVLRHWTSRNREGKCNFHGSLPWRWFLCEIDGALSLTVIIGSESFEINYMSWITDVC